MKDTMVQRFMTVVMFCCFFYSVPASAHLMVSQNGTLKFGKGGYYFVLSLPVSALNGVDDDGDGLLSTKELATHNEAIKATVEMGFTLISTASGPRVIEGLLLNMSHSHGRFQKPASHVVAMGRFSVAPGEQDLTLRTSLFGKATAEQTFKITITNGSRKEVVRLTRENDSWQIFSN